MNKPAMNYQTVLQWFDKAIANTKSYGRLDSALLWTDGKEHLEFMRTQRDELLAALKELVSDVEHLNHKHGLKFENAASLLAAQAAIAKAEAHHD